MRSAVNGGRQAPDLIALAATAVTIAIHLTIKFFSDKPSVPFIVGACLFWTLFVVVRARGNRDAFRTWGFRAENFWPAASASAALFCVGAAAMACLAAYQGNLYLPLHAAALFAFYPIWGVIQQFLALGIVVGNLERVESLRRRRLVIIAGSAILFGLIHSYDWRLAAATFVFELTIIPLYLRYRNLWPLGILQGWLGVLFYLWILHEDLWVETIGR